LVSLRIFSAESKGRRAAGSEATPVLREKTLGAPCPLALPSPAYNLLRQGGGLRDSFLSELLADKQIFTSIRTAGTEPCRSVKRVVFEENERIDGLSTTLFSAIV